MVIRVRHMIVRATRNRYRQSAHTVFAPTKQHIRRFHGYSVHQWRRDRRTLHTSATHSSKAAISPGSSNSPAWTAAESSQSRSTANMVLLHAGCTSITDPCENVKPCVPAISAVPSKDGLPRQPSLIHVPSAMWWRCGVRSRSWRPVKSAAFGPDSTRPWGRRPHVLREKPEIPRKPHMLRRAADSRHDRAAHTVPSRARAAARRARRTERRSERGNGSSYARRPA